MVSPADTNPDKSLQIVDVLIKFLFRISKTFLSYQLITELRFSNINFTYQEPCLQFYHFC
jgi:hypothetical protein